MNHLDRRPRERDSLTDADPPRLGQVENFANHDFADAIRLSLAVIDRSGEPLFTADVTLRRLYERMPQQELNLFQLTSRCVTQAGAASAQVMRPHAERRLARGEEAREGVRD